MPIAFVAVNPSGPRPSGSVAARMVAVFGSVPFLSFVHTSNTWPVGPIAMSPKLQLLLAGMSWRLENFPTCPSPVTGAPAACMIPLLFHVTQTEPSPATIVGWSTDEPFGLGSRSLSPPPGFSPSPPSPPSRRAWAAAIAPPRSGGLGRSTLSGWNVRPPSVLIATGIAPESSMSSHAMKRLPYPSHDSVGSQHALPNPSSRAKDRTSHVAPPSTLFARTIPAPRSRLENSTTWFGSSGSIAIAASDWLPPSFVMFTLGTTVAARAGAAPATCAPSSPIPMTAEAKRLTCAGSFDRGREPRVYPLVLAGWAAWKPRFVWSRSRSARRSWSSRSSRRSRRWCSPGPRSRSSPAGSSSTCSTCSGCSPVHRSPSRSGTAASRGTRRSAWSRRSSRG